MSVPKLRFLEFQDALEWESRKLGDIAPLQRGFDLPSDQIQAGSIPVVYSNGVQKFHSRGMAKGPGLVTGRSGTIGKINFIKEGDYWAHNTTLWVTSFKGNIPKFVYYLYKFIGTTRFASGSGVPTLNRNDVHAFQTYLPTSLLEQQKIADCLTSLESVITAQSQKLEALGVHKRGLMQQLFPSEGETVPKLRFLEFQDAGDWEIQLLGQLVKRVTTGKLDANAMVENGAYRFYTCAKNYYHIDKYAFDGESILIAGNGAYLGYIHYYIGKFNAYQRTYVLQDFGLDALFLKYYLDRHFPARILTEKKEGNTPYIVMATITETPIAFPSLLEQQKIADCLTTLEQLITAQKQKLELLRSHKKGLMQQLFPAPDEAQT